MIESVKGQEKLIRSLSGRIRFRRDLKLLKRIQNKDDKIILTRPLIGLLSPWNKAMLAEIFGDRMINFGKDLSEIRGKEISKAQLYSIFSLSATYERLANNNYDS